MPELAISTNSITKRFRNKTAVHEVSLQVKPGSVYAFLGPNGAGKSTTIRMLLGLLRPTHGHVSMFGLDPRHRTEILMRVGSLVESPSVYEHLSGRENLEIPRRILNAPKSDIDRVLQIAGLAHAARNLVKTFSMGMKQRLGLAQALLGKRELLILDEPTNGLDPAGIQEVRSLIRELPGKHGVTVFLSSHMLSEVEQVATHVGVLSRGEMVFQGDLRELERIRKSCLRIGVSNMDSALKVLNQQGWNVQPSNGYLIALDTTAAPLINRTLVESGHAVHHLAVESLSLEEVFLQMTQAEVC
jgi:ABC-type multidrug transport system ATPase subunit